MTVLLRSAGVKLHIFKHLLDLNGDLRLSNLPCCVQRAVKSGIYSYLMHSGTSDFGTSGPATTTSRATPRQIRIQAYLSNGSTVSTSARW